MTRRTVTLGNVAKVAKGLSYKGAALNRPGPYLIGLGEFQPGGGVKLDGIRTYGGEYQPRHVARPGDLLVALTDVTQTGAVLGSPLIVPDGVGERCLFTHHVGHLTIERPAAVDSRFLYYVLRSSDFAAFAFGYATGTTVRALRPQEAERFEFELPDIAEQRAIAGILGALDDKIELNRRMNETLEAIARALFKSWFVDFDPVRAKVERRPSGLPPHLDAFFPDRFEDSELGEIPAGWRVATIGEALDVNPLRPLGRGDEAPYVDMAALPTTGLAVSDVRPRAFGSGSRFTSGDTLLARITPCLENGKTAFVDFLEEDVVGWGSTEFIVLAAKPPLPPEYAYLLARDDRFRQHAILSMTGSSGRQRVPVDSVAGYMVAVPDDAVARAFGEAVSPTFRRVRMNTVESTTLASARDTLLPKLISGEVRVGGAEREVEAAV